MEKKKILLIDDDEGFNKIIKTSLEQTGKYEVSTEAKASEGLNATKSFKPDLILLDIMMPELDGGDVAGQIKADNSTKDIPIVFLTAAVTKEEVDKEIGVIGGHPFIAKPASIEELIDCIEKNLN